MAKNAYKPGDRERGGARRGSSKVVTSRRTTQSAHTGRFVARRRTTKETQYSRVGSVTTPTHASRPVVARRPARLQMSQANDAQRRQLVHNALVRAGLISVDPAPLTDARPLPDGERNALAHQVARGRPLSEYIGEEREGR